MQLKNNQFQNIRQIANAHPGRTATLARNILCFGYQECESEFAPTPSARKKAPRVYDMNKQLSLESTEKEVETKLNLYPNPTKENVTLKIANFNATNNYTVELKALNGKLLLQQKVSQATQTLNLKGKASGTYFVILFENGEQVEQTVLIKQ